MAETQALFIRHGESVLNSEGRVAGRTEAPLTRKGIDQAIAVGERIKHLKLSRVAFSSPQGRAVHTASLCMQIARPAGDTQIIAHRDLMERNYGELEGRVWDEVKRELDIETSIIDDPNWRPKGGESLRDIQRRVVPLWEKHIRPMMKKGRILTIFGHGGLFRAIFGYLEGERNLTKYHIGNCEPFLFTFTDDGGKVISSEKL